MGQNSKDEKELENEQSVGGHGGLGVWGVQYCWKVMSYKEDFWS